MLIFLPNKFAANPQHLLDVGLGELLRPDDDQPLCCDLQGPGPGNLCGQVWGWGAPGYAAATQTWHQARGKSYWYGFDNRKPIEQQLRRTAMIPGRLAELGGIAWQIPTVDEVPHRIDLNAAGELIKVPDEPYARFAGEAGEAMAAGLEFARNQGAPPDWTWQRLTTFLVSALSLNYRLNLELVCRLNLLRDADLWRTVIRVGEAEQIAAILAELEKKSAPAAPPGSAPSGG